MSTLTVHMHHHHNLLGLSPVTQRTTIFMMLPRTLPEDSQVIGQRMEKCAMHGNELDYTKSDVEVSSQLQGFYLITKTLR